MYFIVIQFATDKAIVPKRSLLKKWAEKALSSKIESAEVTLRIVNKAEMAELNLMYRQKHGPTNVLSFPFTIADDITLDIPFLGDIIICADVVNQEASEQNKSQDAHWAHIVMHGILHLLGYDHENDKDADIMERLEINLMENLGFENPYESGDHV